MFAVEPDDRGSVHVYGNQLTARRGGRNTVHLEYTARLGNLFPRTWLDLLGHFPFSSDLRRHVFRHLAI
jgi:hypothetical protein